MRVRFVVVGKTNDPTVSEVELPFTIGRSEEADWRIPHCKGSMSASIEPAEGDEERA